MRNEEIVEVTVHEIKRAQTLLATFFFFYGVFDILMTMELSSNGIVVRFLFCFHSYNFSWTGMASYALIMQIPF